MKLATELSDNELQTTNCKLSAVKSRSFAGLLFKTLLILSLLSFNNKATAAAISSTTTGGNWNATGTWVGGVVPGSADDVTIVNGATVTLDVDVRIISLIVASGGILKDNGTTKQIIVTGSAGTPFSVAAGGTFSSSGNIRIIYGTAGTVTFTAPAGVTS